VDPCAPNWSTKRELPVLAVLRGAGCRTPARIVGGNTTRLIRSRYSEPDITRLLTLAWWDWPAEHLTGIRAPSCPAASTTSSHRPALNVSDVVREGCGKRPYWMCPSQRQIVGDYCSLRLRAMKNASPHGNLELVFCHLSTIPPGR
jgi:hypothetical protein